LLLGKILEYLRYIKTIWIFKLEVVNKSMYYASHTPVDWMLIPERDAPINHKGLNNGSLNGSLGCSIDFLRLKVK
jgi:hypothetical protein